MDYYQGVVTDYLRADRSIFLNTEFCLQRNHAANPDQSGPHWYVDVVACSFRDQRVFLCEISFAKGLGALINRLGEWALHWDEICAALVRDAHVPEKWIVRPWLFVPELSVPKLVRKLSPLMSGDERKVPTPRITTLEMTQPWLYRSWSRTDEAVKPDSIPLQMQD